MTIKREYRALDVQADGEEMHVTGYAAVFNERTLLWESEYSGYRYYEMILPGAFAHADMSDVVMRYNHGDSALILARTSNNTLQLAEDSRGLRISATLADTTAGRDIYALIKRGDISKMSFAFTVDRETATDDREAKIYLRKIESFGTIFDVAPVDFPAYDGTSLEARSADYFKDLEQTMQEAELRKRLRLQTYL